MNPPAALQCPRCGRAALPDDRFCGRCGVPLAQAEPAADTGTPFVGRQRELNALSNALAKSRGGAGRIVLVRGEAGVGKTRIAEEVARQAQAQGLRVVWGRCSEDDGAPPYWPWIQAVRALVEAAGTDNLLRAAGIAAGSLVEWLPELSARLPSVRPPPRIDDPVQARFRLFDALATFWKRSAGLHPLLLVLDDLHRADAASLALLSFLAPEVADAPLLVLATSRDESEGDDAFAVTLAALMRLPSFYRVELRGLTLTETAQFVSAAAGLRSPQLAAELHQRTEGNPLFLAEMTRLLSHDQSADGRADERDALGRIDGLPVPDGVRDAIGARLRRLSAPCRTVLDGAALIGRAFDAPVLARVVPDVPLDAALAEARAARLVEPLVGDAGGPGRWRFGHVLMRDVLEAQLPPPRRGELHLRVAEALEAVHAADLGPQLAALAHHRAAALPLGDAARAGALAQAAAERSLALYATDAAARLYRLALRLLDGADAARELALRLALGAAEVAAGEPLQARATYERAASLARAQGDASALARAALGCEEAAWRPGVTDARVLPLLHDAIARVGDTQQPVLRARLASALTRALIFAGAAGEAEAAGAQAVALARASGDVPALIGALSCGLSARWLPAKIDARVTAAAEAMQLAHRIGDLEHETEAACWHLFDRIERHADADVARLLDTHGRLVEALRQPFYRYVNLTLRALTAGMRGDLSDAEWFAMRGLEVGSRLPGIDAAGVFGLQMFSLRREQGRLAEVAPLLQPFVEATPSARTWLPGLALLYAELGQRDNARAAFERAWQGFEPVPRDAMWLASTVLLAETCVALDDAPRAAALYRALLPYLGRNLMVGSSVALGTADRVLGMLAGTQGDWDSALGHFDAAIAKDERQRAAAWLAHDHHHLALALLARGNAADCTRAASLLDSARDSARRFGMAALLARLDAMAPPPAPAATGPALSEREIGVLKLVAQGRSNREIGEALGLSPNTVANHLRRILGRTGCANRAEAAAFAVRQGLIEATD
jgi:DNA-binding CsgD family transcriptional regulator/tetratricopeptide (TPR) repeat protein